MLREKHSKDVFVKECKDGPTWTGTHLRMDAWVMRSSWAQMSCLAYEVKVSRSDFLHDSKWNMYMNYCNEFSFCCPYGLILPEELPQEVGLYWVSKTGNRLMCKRKPVYRNVKIPESIFMYILMCRVIIKDTEIYKTSDKKYWEEWIKTKEVDHNFGLHVSKTISEVVKKEIEAVREENKKMKALVENVQEAIKTFEEAGLTLGDLKSWSFKWKVQDTIQRIKQLLPDDLINSLNNVQKHISSILNKVKQNDLNKIN